MRGRCFVVLGVVAVGGALAIAGCGSSNSSSTEASAHGKMPGGCEKLEVSGEAEGCQVGYDKASEGIEPLGTACEGMHGVDTSGCAAGYDLAVWGRASEYDDQEDAARACSEQPTDDAGACRIGYEGQLAGDPLSDVCEGQTGALYTSCNFGYEWAEEGVGKAGGDEHVTEERTKGEVTDLGESGTVYLRSPEAYSGEITLERGRVEKVTLGQLNGELSEGAACEIDPQTDAVEPIYLEVTNTTKDFSASPAAVLHATKYGPDPAVSIELDYTEGPVCGKENGMASEGAGEEHNLFNFGPNNPLEPQNSISAYGFVVLENYYSPANPSGNAAQFTGVLLTVEPGYSDEGFVGVRSTGFKVKSKTEPVSPGMQLKNSWYLLP